MSDPYSGTVKEGELDFRTNVTIDLLTPSQNPSSPGKNPAKIFAPKVIFLVLFFLF